MDHVPAILTAFSAQPLRSALFSAQTNGAFSPNGATPPEIESQKQWTGRSVKKSWIFRRSDSYANAALEIPPHSDGVISIAADRLTGGPSQGTGIVKLGAQR